MGYSKRHVCYVNIVTTILAIIIVIIIMLNAFDVEIK